MLPAPVADPGSVTKEFAFPLCVHGIATATSFAVWSWPPKH